MLVGIDDESRRIAWTITNLPGATHHNGAAHVVPEGRDGGHCRFIWYTDVLPDALADRLAPLMEQGINAIKRELESRQ